MKVALYIRVSTEEQAREGYSIGAQKDRITKFIQSQDWEIADFYIDDGYSAKNLERPAMKQLIKDAKTNKFQVVVFYKLDRLVRSVTDLHELLQLFEYHNIAIRSVSEIFDTTTAIGRLFITMVAAMAQWERETIAERVIEGMTKKALGGERNGGRAPFGYESINGELILKEDEARMVREIYRMYLSGKGMRTIALFFNHSGFGSKGAKSIARILENPVYCGKVRWNNDSKRDNIIVDASHPSIIDELTFENVQKLRKKRFVDGKTSTSIYNFSGVLKCGRCGRALTGFTKKSNKKKYYVCSGRHELRICDLPMFTEDALINSFLDIFNLDNQDKLFTLLNLDTEEQNEKDNNDVLIEQLKNEFETIKKRKKKWLIALGNETISEDDYKEMTEEDNKRERIINQQLEELCSSALPPSMTREQLLEYIKGIPKLFSYSNDYERKTFINDLFSKIIVNVNLPEGFKAGPGKAVIPFIQQADLNNE